MKYFKNIKTEAVFTKAELNNEWNINLINSTHLFQLVFHWLKYFWLCVKLYYHISFKVVQILPLRWIFSWVNRKKLYRAESAKYGERCTCTILYFTKTTTQKYLELAVVILQTGAVINQWRCHETSAYEQNDLQS